MNAMPETLQQLVGRRLDEMGRSRGRNEPLTLREAYLAVREPHVTYEVVRRVAKSGHTRIGDAAVSTLATMLDLPENEIRAAAGQQPSLGPWVPPAVAAKLTTNERQALNDLIKAMIQERERLGVPERRPAPLRAAEAHQEPIGWAALEGRPDMPLPSTSEEPTP